MVKNEEKRSEKEKKLWAEWEVILDNEPLDDDFYEIINCRNVKTVPDLQKAIWQELKKIGTTKTKLFNLIRETALPFRQEIAEYLLDEFEEELSPDNLETIILIIGDTTIDEKAGRILLTKFPKKSIARFVIENVPTLEEEALRLLPVKEKEIAANKTKKLREAVRKMKQQTTET